MPSKRSRPNPFGAISVAAFCALAFFAAVVQAACGCFGCLSGSTCTGLAPVHVLFETAEGAAANPHRDGEFPSADFRVGDRWDRTATEGSIGRAQGTPTTVTWGIVADGTSITGSREGTSPSDLVAMLDARHGASPTGLHADAPWFRFFEESFDRWSAISGINYVYEPNDGGAPITNSFAAQAGVPGQYADSRIGGHFVGTFPTPDGGVSNVLAYNYFPNHGDMVIDTDDAAFYGNSFEDFRLLRNVIMHEAGHGLGFNHVDTDNSRQLMEPFIQGNFDGPQIDDIQAAHRNYGDVLEKGLGNDSARNPTDLGVFDGDDLFAIGSDGRKSVVEFDDVDFVSIDGSTDLDFYEFGISEHATVDIFLTQVGIAYNEGPQDGDQTLFDASDQNPLSLTLLSGVGGRGIVVEAEGIPFMRGSRGALLRDFELSPSRDYFVQVNGSVDRVQLYELSLAFTAIPIPEPSSITFIAISAIAGIAGRRRAA